MNEDADARWAEDFDECLCLFHAHWSHPPHLNPYEDLCQLLTGLRTNDDGSWPDSIRRSIANMLKDEWHISGADRGGLWMKDTSPSAYDDQARLIRFAYSKRDPDTNERIIRYFKQAYAKTTDPEILSQGNVRLLRKDLGIP